MEQLTEILAILKTIIIPTGLVTIIIGWFGKRYLDKKLESEKTVHQEKIKSIENRLDQSLEIHKQKIKNWEFFFQKQFDASHDLYIIKTDMMPPYHPNMDWGDAITEMADGLEKTFKSLREFLKNHFTVLNPDILEQLEVAVMIAEEGMFYGGDEDDGGALGNQCAEDVYNRIKACTALLKAEVDGQRLVEFHEKTDENYALLKAEVDGQRVAEFHKDTDENYAILESKIRSS